MSKLSLLKITLLLFISTFAMIELCAQTFFETAEDDGIVSFSTKRVSQIKLNMSSTAISYGFYYLKGDAPSKTRFLLNGQIKAKPTINLHSNPSASSCARISRQRKQHSGSSCSEASWRVASLEDNIVWVVIFWIFIALKKSYVWN